MHLTSCSWLLAFLCSCACVLPYRCMRVAPRALSRCAAGRTLTTAAVQTSEADLCLSYYEHQCAGICSSEKRLGPIYRSCLQDPLRTGANPGNLPEIDEGSIRKEPL